MQKLSESQSASIWLRQRIAAWGEAPPDVQELNEVLRRMGRWRSRLLANTYVARQGTRVLQGPFAGMDFVAEAAEGALIPKLLGLYEAELHPHFAAFAEAGLDCVIDVGCAEGYYAVGLAMTMPGVTVHAHDIDEAARLACAELAARNGVADRVMVGGEFKPSDFEGFAGRRVLVLVDAEGAELDILQPELSPALAHMAIIVETHDVYRPGALALLTERFATTHHITRVDHQARRFELPEWLRELSQLDQLLSGWEWRAAATPWLVMRPLS